MVLRTTSTVIASHDSAEAISPFCPCEERSDEANLGELYEIATPRQVGARNDKRGELRSVVAEFISALYARSSPLRIRGARGVTVITPFYPPYLKGDVRGG